MRLPNHNASYFGPELFKPQAVSVKMTIIEQNLITFKNKGEIIMCGDFSARTGSCLDFIDKYDSDHLPLYKIIVLTTI